MKHHACIAIGINQYECLQPLNYAQQDAEALYEFLVGKMQFDPQRCLLLTDSSPVIRGECTRPTRENIWRQVEDLCQQKLGPEDTLWCFFSGYGIHHQGHEYLLPIDGVPEEVETSGIAVHSLMTLLQMSQVETVLVLLDMNRNQGAKAGQGLGEETMALATQMGVPTILSCRPNQVSREASALRHGFFTATLLEGLNAGHGMTLSSLSRFLSERLPELSDHHLRPKQEPVIMGNTPEQLDEALLLPLEGELRMPAPGERNGAGTWQEVGEGLTPLAGTATVTALRTPSEVGVNGSQSETNGSDPWHNGSESPTNGAYPPGENPSEADDPAATEEVLTESALSESTPADFSSKETMSEQPFLPKLITWTGGIAALLLLGVVISNRSVFFGQSSPATTSVPTAQANAPAPTAADTANTSPAPTTADAGSTSPAPTTAAETVSTTPTSGTVGGLLLNQAQTRIQENSASRFSEAISLASQIPSNDPRYQDAQVMIERWNQTILDIANGRAGQGNYQGAIAAAVLVSSKSQGIHQQAQDNIALWQQQLKLKEANQALINTAKKQINRGEASSYSKAISQVSTIQRGQPLYEEAQGLIDNWSNTILSIAQLRARRGEYGNAIGAAQLVPSNTSYYQTAQTNIAEWQQKLESQKKKS